MSSCPAVANAKASKNISNSEIAAKIGTTEQHLNAVLSGAEKPTSSEFDNLANVLDIKQSAPKDGAHTTK